MFERGDALEVQDEAEALLPLETPIAAEPHVSARRLGLSERDDTYPVIVQLDGRHRVIDCRDGVQWIVQRWRGADHWEGMSFCRTRAGLIQFARERITPNSEWPLRELAPDALAVLLALPERHP